MKHPTSSLLVAATALAFGVSLGGSGCATDDMILAIEEPAPDAGLTLVPDASSTTSPKCGDRRLDDGEECDDGNTKDGDGCSASCKSEGASAGSCPGTALTLASPSATKRTASVTGNTSSSGSSFESATCGGKGGKDAAYSFTSDLDGVATIKVQSTFDAIVSARSACADAASEIRCKATPSGAGTTEIAVAVKKGQTTFVVVDGAQGKAGTYQLDVTIGETSCGDGVAAVPEQCDDGNTVAGDGCSPSCQLEAVGAGAGKCPGQPYTIVGDPNGPKTVSFAGDVSQLANTMGAFGCSGALGPDQVYALTPTTSGAITVQLVATYGEAVLHVRGECFSSGTELDCKEQPLADKPVKTTFPVTAQSTYFVFVDTDTTKALASGAYRLDVTLAPAKCGNGELETPETCDDGNTADGDGCSATCALEPFPAGIDTCPGAPLTLSTGPDDTRTFRTTASTTPLTAAVRSCVGQTNRKDAVYSFVAPYDGWISAKAKGTFNLSLDVRSNCVLESATAQSTGSVGACGSKMQGDDEETIAGPIAAGQTYYVIIDGPFSATNLEGPFTVEGEIRRSVCGNGIIEGGETCDDGALDGGDGCDASCQIEPVPSTRTTCATAEALVLTESAPGVFTTKVTGGNWNLPGGGYFTAPCAAAGKEAYFTITPAIDGVVTAKVDATYNISLGVRPSCPPNTSSGFLTCSNRSAGPGGESIAFAATANTTYWIIVDAPGTKDLGRFTMDVALKDASCGDGLVSGTEQCDDGNTTAGDGCSATCTLEPLAGVDACPGTAVSLTGMGTATRSKVVSLSTTALSSSYGGSCGGSGRDGVVAVTSDIAGTLIAQLFASWPSVLYARTTCNDSSTELSCKAYDATKPNETTRELTFPVVANAPTYLFVDGIGQGAGPATLSLTVTP